MSNTLPMSIGPRRVKGELCLMDPPRGIVVFTRNSGSNGHSHHNRQMAEFFQRKGLGTLSFDLLTDEEAANRVNVFDIPLLARRITDAIDCLSLRSNQPLGLFGASTGAGAALVAAALRPEIVKAVVSHGGRPDLAGNVLVDVLAPTLLIVGGADTEVVALNRTSLARMQCEKQFEIVPHATDLLEGAGGLDVVAGLAGAWFLKHFHAAEHRDRRWNADQGESNSEVVCLHAPRDFDSVVRFLR